MTVEHIDTLVVGAGQAGLVMSHMLGRRGRRHLVLERSRIAERWRSERWEGLRFQFPNWSVRLPDFPYQHAEPEAFATKADVIAYLEAYAQFVAAPVRCGVAVTALRGGQGNVTFVAETSDGPITARNVVVATGPYQRPKIPSFAAASDLLQLHASAYRTPEQLPAGAVLVVGSGASGAQIADELVRAGRRVYLSVGRHRRMPRRYRGRDFIWWLHALGLYETTVDQRGPPLQQPLISGAYGGYTVDLREFAARGAILLGRATQLSDGVLGIADDLTANLSAGDAALDAFLEAADRHVATRKLDLPVDRAAWRRVPEADCVASPILRLDLRDAGIHTIIWATGYRPDFGWIRLPVLHEDGAPLHERGVTDIPGLYFLGLQWLAKMKSSFLSGVDEDAARIADIIVART